MKEEKERNEVVEVSIACECQGKENGEDDEAMHSLLLWRETERERERERERVCVCCVVDDVSGNVVCRVCVCLWNKLVT